MTLFSVAVGILAKASLVGAKMVKGPGPLRVSPRPAAVTAATRVERAGLFDAAVAAGSSAIPSKLPAPLVGTAAQPGPKLASVRPPMVEGIVVALPLPEAAVVSVDDDELSLPQATTPSERAVAMPSAPAIFRGEVRIVVLLAGGEMRWGFTS